MSLTEAASLLDSLRDIPGFAERAFVAQQRSPRAGNYAEPRTQLPNAVLQARESLGIDRLYTHQAEAYDAVVEGGDVVVVTGTNSGKTLCYALPGLHLLTGEPAARALLLYPSKALAQDQLGRLQSLWEPGGLKVATYDGDTPKSQRSTIRQAAHAVLTNPDMLHVGILPSHELWTKFLKSLRLIVLDEIHSYSGLFGAHVGMVLRRLLRLCAWHGARPQIVACSATIGNAVELFQKLTLRTPVLLDRDGSPQGPRTTVFWSPPAQQNGEPGSSNFETGVVLAGLAERGLTTLAFSRSRIASELVLRYARDHVDPSRLPQKAIESYRSGYTPKERRSLEKALLAGKLKGLSATNAMELGVDVGSLDAVILNGFPGTLASYAQMTGRAGRGMKPSLAVYVPGSDALDYFLVRQPDLLLSRSPERVALNPENRAVMQQHLQCAAFERPISGSELPMFGQSADSVLSEMEGLGDLETRGGRSYYPKFEAPAPKVSLRGTGGTIIHLVVGGEVLGQMDQWRAQQEAHQGAVYLHRGHAYRVRNLDLTAGVATLDPEEPSYYTRPVVETVVEPVVGLEVASWGERQVEWAALRVTEVVGEYVKCDMVGGQVIEREPLELPPRTFQTLGIRLDIELDFSAGSERAVGGLHGLEHALATVAPVLTGCDRSDLGTCWYTVYPDSMKAALFVYDRMPGGVGLTESLYLQRGAWARAALALLTSCPCEEGCPLCLMQAQCPYHNESLNKLASLDFLHSLIAGVPDQP